VYYTPGTDASLFWSEARGIVVLYTIEKDFLFEFQERVSNSIVFLLSEPTTVLNTSNE
jgi:hypothetical protein